MTKFKAGDYVQVVVGAPSDGLYIGSILQVVEPKDKPLVSVIHENGMVRSYFSYRFELAKQTIVHNLLKDL